MSGRGGGLNVIACNYFSQSIFIFLDPHLFFLSLSAAEAAGMKGWSTGG